MRFPVVESSKIHDESGSPDLSGDGLRRFNFEKTDMQRLVSSNIECPCVLASNLEQIHQQILSASWKVSGCGLAKGALSCALFMSHYAAMCGRADLTAEIQELFDRGCNGVVSGKTGWLDFADLALVAHKLSGQNFVQLEQDYFFEDIDKLALAVMARPGHIAGFENSDLGAVLYALRRHSAGAAHFSGPIRQFTSTMLAGVDVAATGQGNGSLQTGLSAALLFVSAAAEIGLVEKSKRLGAVSTLARKICRNVKVSSQIDHGFQTGDVGKGYALLRAGMCFHNQEWITAGLQILIDCAYSVLDHGIGTLDVASGAAGIALAFHKLYLLSGYDIFRRAAHQARWLSLKSGVLVDERNIDQGYSFYHGLSGIGLATLHWQQGRPEELNEFVWLL